MINVHQCVDVNPDAIRHARLAARLSLADVAGSDLSRSEVHRVETGKVRPSMRTLLLIAERTGAGIEPFLTEKASSEIEGEGAMHSLELARLEAMTAEGRYREAALRADALLQRTEGAWVRARLHYWAGVIRVNLLEAATALVHLRTAREAFVRARCLDGG